MKKKAIKIECKYYVCAVVTQHDEVLDHDFVYRYAVNCDSVQAFADSVPDMYPHASLRFLGVFYSDMDYRSWFCTN